MLRNEDRAGEAARPGEPRGGPPPGPFGISAGHVIQRDLDYCGQTVNVAARLVDYARPGEVLASDAAVAATSEAEPHFTEIGPVILKGISELVTVYAAENAPGGAAT